MADRTSAALFSEIFGYLAGESELTAIDVWNMTCGYDFDPYQMGCDDALEKLGLMVTCKDPECGAGNYGPDVSNCEECGKELR